MPLTLVVIGKNGPYISAPFEDFLILVVSGKNVSYIGGQWEEYHPYRQQKKVISVLLLALPSRVQSDTAQGTPSLFWREP